MGQQIAQGQYCFAKAVEEFSKAMLRFAKFGRKRRAYTFDFQSSSLLFQKRKDAH